MLPAVKHHGRPQGRGVGRYQVGHPPTHAEPGDANPVRRDLRHPRGVFDGGVDIADDLDVAQAAHAGENVLAAVRVLAVVQLRRDRDVARGGEAAAHLLDERIDAARVLDHNDGRERTRAFRRRHVAAHRLPVNAQRVPSRFHRILLRTSRGGSCYFMPRRGAGAV